MASERLKILSDLAKWAPYVFIFIGFVIATCGQFFKERVKDIHLAKKMPYLFMFLGLIVAICGQSVKVSLEEHIKDIRAQSEQAFKQTEPKCDTILTVERDGSFRLIIKSMTNIPFLARWYVNTKNETVSGMMLSSIPLHPNEKTDTWNFQLKIQKDRIIDGYLELIFRYESIYAAEFGYPERLIGNVIHKYHYENGKLTPL